MAEKPPDLESNTEASSGQASWKSERANAEMENMGKTSLGSKGSVPDRPICLRRTLSYPVGLGLETVLKLRHHPFLNCW